MKRSKELSLLFLAFFFIILTLLSMILLKHLIEKISSNTLSYLFSTLSQTFSALLGFLAIFYIIRIQRVFSFKDQQKVFESEKLEKWKSVIIKDFLIPTIPCFFIIFLSIYQLPFVDSIKQSGDVFWIIFINALLAETTLILIIRYFILASSLPYSKDFLEILFQKKNNIE